MAVKVCPGLEAAIRSCTFSRRRAVIHCTGLMPVSLRKRNCRLRADLPVIFIEFGQGYAIVVMAFDIFAGERQRAARSRVGLRLLGEERSGAKIIVTMRSNMSATIDRSILAGSDCMASIIEKCWLKIS